MPTFKEHCQESFESFGDTHAQIHLWLDEFAGKNGYGMRHRKKRYHREGIEEIKKQFGNEAANAAMQHIMSDLKKEVWKEGDRIPENEKAYVEMGFF